MKVLRKQFLVILTVVMGISTVIGAVITYFIFPPQLYIAYFSIPLFYYVVGLAFGEVLRRINRESNERLTNIYLMLKVAKVIVTVMFMVLCMLFIEVKEKEFVVTILIFYMIYLVLESKFYFDFEKSIKRKKTNEKLKV